MYFYELAWFHVLFVSEAKLNLAVKIITILW